MAEPLERCPTCGRSWSLQWAYADVTGEYLKVCQPCFYEELVRALPQVRSEVFMDPPLNKHTPLARPAPEEE